LDYIKELLLTDKYVPEEKVEDFLNSTIVFYSEKNYDVKELFNPNYFLLLYDLVVNSESIAIYSTEKELFEDFFIGFFGTKKVNDNLFVMDEKNFYVLMDQNGIFLNMEPISNNVKNDYIVSGSIDNILKDNDSWEFYIDVESRTINAKFVSKEYRSSKNQFDLTSLENKKLFGEVLVFESVNRNDFENFYTKFFTPLDEESEKSIDFLKEIIKEDEFIVVSSQSINENELVLFVESTLDSVKLKKYAEERRMEEGKIGTYNYYLWSKGSYPKEIYLYFQNDELIFSNITPDRMGIYLSEMPRFKNTKYFDQIKNNQQFHNMTIIDLSNYISKNYYGSVDSWIVKSEYLEDDNYTLKINMR
jgi:hypothetical protein